jgi:hypothetical protein
MKTPLRFLLVILLLSFGAARRGWAQGPYQAENAQLSGAYAGAANGVGYASLPTWSSAASVTFTSVTVAEAKTYAVAFRYANAQPWAARLSIYLNEVDVTQAFFPSTTAWGVWATQTVTLALRQGSNKVMIRYDADDSGGIDLDYLQVTPDPLSTGFKPGAAPTAGWFPQEISVDKFTGTAQVYLPLHTVQATGIALPIGLSYAATGVPVDDRGGRVGINWALTGGVSISREVRGLPDDRAVVDQARNEYRYGWLVYPSNTPNGNTPDAKINAVPDDPAALATAGCRVAEQTALQKLNQLGNLQQGLPGPRNFYDSEPDIFTYSLPGHSGKFVFDAQGNARTIPYDHITISHPPLTSAGIPSFTLRTADGTSYAFDLTETVAKKIVNVAATPAYFLREYQLYKLPDNAQSFAYTYSWLASEISTVAGEVIHFTYRPGIAAANPAKSSRLILRGAASGNGVEEFKTETTVTKKWLESITSPATRVNFNLALADETEYFVQSVEVLSTAVDSQPLVRRYLLDYLSVESGVSGGYDSKGNPLSDELPATRRFLASIRVTNGCSTQPVYDFAYDQVSKISANDPLYPDRLKDVVALPLPGANDRDYWGYYTPNGSRTLVPQLYVYPQLLTPAQPVPAAPYRLFEAATSAYASGGFVLAGADRRPAAYVNFQPALAGTLTAMTLPGGGKALFEYEAHRFYDPVAQQSYPAGGTRIRAIRAQDPVTGVEARREYGYQEDDGRASGVLLRAPRFAFALPAMGSASQPQWSAATARCGDDLAEDPFETRPIGYHQVSEQMTGKGQVITAYHVPASADESTAADGAAAGISWSRAVMGVARDSYTSPLTGSTNCPSVAPLVAGTDLYPFAPATNYDFRRGLPQSILYKAEPVGTAAAATVRRETFAYEYRILKPSQLPVVGLAYEQLTSGHNVYAYAKYPILTDFLYAIRHQTEVMPNGTTADNQSDTWYNYNAQGWLAAQGKTNSDGKGYRTRYKYLTDYALTGTSTEPRFQALQQRLTSASEQISATPVETISEVVVSPSDVRFAGATLNTFSRPNPTALTRPDQVLRWQPATPLPEPYDSTRVESVTGGMGLHIPPGFRVASTLLETGVHQAPVSTRTEAGRQLASVHLGFNNTLPVLQIANALASEVLFSDFESPKDFSFSTSQGLATSAQAARTGQAGVELATGSFLSAQLPSSSAGRYRLRFWARTTTTATITVTVAGGSSGTPPAAQTVGVASTSGNWLPYNGGWLPFEVTLDLSGVDKIFRSGYTLKLLTDAAVQLDDVLFLPADAAAASTAYDVTKGKTAETDGRGRTVFYEYNVLGDLNRVRDHNGAIVKQIDKVIAGRVPEISPSFLISGSQYDGLPLTFTANGSCASDLQYSWDFGDGSTLAFPASASVSHPFNTAGQIHLFAVTLSARVAGQNKVYRSVQYVEIHPVPVTVNSCFRGVLSIDRCGHDADVLVNSCDPTDVPSATSPRPSTNTYSVVAPSGSLYTWMVREAYSTSWQVMPGETGAAITVALDFNSMEQAAYQCLVSNASGVTVGVSEVFSLQCYASQGTPLYPCATP